MATPEHWRSQPIVLDASWVISAIHGGDEQAARAEPREDAVEERAELVTRNMNDCIECDDGVEAARWEFNSCHVGRDERGLWECDARERNASRRDVDTGQAEM